MNKMKKYPKPIKKNLKELVSVAYKRELDNYTEHLAKYFDRWRTKKIDCFQLKEIIHKFHNGIFRELWKKYNLPCEDVLISMAVAKNIIKKEEINPDTFEHIKDMIDSYKSLYIKTNEPIQLTFD
ncbi:MAG: hypothetical protein ISS33_00980 [Candidatus Omnitrophica bacterium]|nr:hypothetical protein [Candidatus Omnitrophota bacterium]